jgi:hypothetical protein
VKLFQIEEPAGGPPDPSAPGAAISIDASRLQIEVAFSVGGNAVILTDREGFERTLPVPGMEAGELEWEQVIEAARIRAERALASPVTHAVIVIPGAANARVADRLRRAAEQAGLVVLRLVATADLPAGIDVALAAAMLAEDLAPRSELGR